MSPRPRLPRPGPSARARADGQTGQALVTLRGALPRRAPRLDGRPQARGGRILRLDRWRSYADWLDERDARVPAPPDRRVQLVSESGKTIASTSESNAERMVAALEPRHGPRTVVPA